MEITKEYVKFLVDSTSAACVKRHCNRQIRWVLAHIPEYKSIGMPASFIKSVIRKDIAQFKAIKNFLEA